ncbi:hypothetical protein [Sideroxydans sp.]
MKTIHSMLLAMCMSVAGGSALAMEEKGHGAMEMKKSDMAMEQGAMRMERHDDKMMKQDKMEKKKLTAKEKKALKMKKDKEKKMKQEAMMKEDKMEHGTMQRMQ